MDNEEYRNRFWLVKASEFMLSVVEFRRIGSSFVTGLKNADSVVVAIPKDGGKFVKGRGAVFHGGVAPSEMFTAFGIFEFS